MSNGIKQAPRRTGLFSGLEGKPCFARRSAPALAAALMLVAGLGTGTAQVPGSRATLAIDPAKVVAPVSPLFYGMMTEEINHAFDGGLYGELLQNRTFRPTWQGVEHWTLVRQGSAAASMTEDRKTGPSTALRTSVKLQVTSAGEGSEAGISNAGFWGVPVRQGEVLNGSFYARVGETNPGNVTARLISDRTGAVLASATVALHSGAWSRYEYKLTPEHTPATSEVHLQLTVAQPGTVWMQLASLMGPTYHGRANGNRPDLMEKMAGLHPTFLRMPGGNYLEGDNLADWYNWKETIGPLVDRPGHQAPWTYWSTDGMGLLEFLEWCEDLKIEPVLAVYAGYSLHGQHVEPGVELEPYVQSALDEVEYVTGSTSTKWGAERAKDGHPAPFPLHYIEIGNEDFFDRSGSYDGRFAQFALALRKQYPQYKLISTTPVTEEPGAMPDVQDDHYYKPSGEMLDFVHHYDTAPRTGPKLFIGEWATLSGTPTPDFGGALADAAWMTGMERNSDLIVMAAYAPLLVNVNPLGSQWVTNLIGYDAMTSYASPSYYAQAMFAAHLGDGLVSSTLTGAGSRFFSSATVGSTDHVLHLKLVNASTQAQALTVELPGVHSEEVPVYRLHAATFEATNSLHDPNFVTPTQTRVRVSGSSWQYTVAPLTIEVLDIPLR